jgi:hypothetical protein
MSAYARDRKLPIRSNEYKIQNTLMKSDARCAPLSCVAQKREATKSGKKNA